MVKIALDLYLKRRFFLVAACTHYKMLGVQYLGNCGATRNVYFKEAQLKKKIYYRPRSEGDNALGSVRPSVRLSVCLCSHG